MREPMDPEMRELVELLGSAVVPESRRRAVRRENLHAPYYSRNRYAKY